MLMRPDAPSMILANARLVLPDRVIDGHVSVSGGTIAAIDAGNAPSHGIDLEGDYLLPGLVDIHTDHFEKHVYPRAHVRWDFMRAALSHDAQIIGAGITTVFDSLCVGALIDDPKRQEILAPMLDALETAQDGGMLRAEHLVHLRCEVTDEQTPNLAAANIERDIVRLMSVMEHVPGIRQSKDLRNYIARHRARTGETEATIRRMIEDMVAQSATVGDRVRPKVVALAHEHKLPLLSHDDTEPEHVDRALSEGITVSEFPCSLIAARLAREHGMTIVAGAPNILRGGSQSGNVAVRDLIAEHLVDALASDYVPRSLLDCIFEVSADDAYPYDLPEAVRLVTQAPARIAGLDDRGEIAVGKRADLLQVGIHAGHPYLKCAWRNGDRVL